MLCPKSNGGHLSDLQKDVVGSWPRWPGKTAEDMFWFSVLEVEWICERVEPLAPFAECFEKMYVMRRRVNQG